MQVEGYRGPEQGLGVARRGIGCRATSVPRVAAGPRKTGSLGRRDHKKSGRYGRFPYSFRGSALEADAYSPCLPPSRCASFSRMRADFPERSRR
jgi:hypothetical protein